MIVQKRGVEGVVEEGQRGSVANAKKNYTRPTSQREKQCRRSVRRHSIRACDMIRRDENKERGKGESRVQRRLSRKTFGCMDIS